MKMKDMLAAILKVCRCNGHRLKRADVIVKSLSGDNMIFHSIMAQECPAGMDKHDHDGGCGSSC